MKHGKINEFLKKIVIATLYFMIAAIFTMFTGASVSKVCNEGTPLDSMILIINITVSIVFIILFVSSWENIFESEDEL